MDKSEDEDDDDISTSPEEIAALLTDFLKAVEARRQAEEERAALSKPEPEPEPFLQPQTEFEERVANMLSGITIELELLNRRIDRLEDLLASSYGRKNPLSH